MSDFDELIKVPTSRYSNRCLCHVEVEYVDGEKREYELWVKSYVSNFVLEEVLAGLPGFIMGVRVLKLQSVSFNRELPVIDESDALDVVESYPMKDPSSLYKKNTGDGRKESNVGSFDEFLKRAQQNFDYLKSTGQGR